MLGVDGVFDAPAEMKVNPATLMTAQTTTRAMRVLMEPPPQVDGTSSTIETAELIWEQGAAVGLVDVTSEPRGLHCGPHNSP